MNNNIIIPVVTYIYTYTDKNKSLIIRYNNNKSGIYRWNNLFTGKSYVGSSVNLAGILSIYYT